MNTTKQNKQNDVRRNGGEGEEEYKTAKVRLSGHNYGKLVAAGLNADSEAHIVFNSERIPLELMKPSSWRNNDKYVGLTWNSWDINTRRDCGCGKNGEDEDCDHFWHDWTICRSEILSEGKLTVKWAKFDSPDHVAQVFINGRLYATEEARERREAIRDALNSAHKKIWERKLDKRQTRLGEPNMNHDNADKGLASQTAAGPEQLEVDVAGNIGLTTARADSKGRSATIPETKVVSEYFTEQRAEFRHLTDRPLALPTTTWSTTDAAGAIIARYEMPYDLIANNLNTPNTTPFRTYAFSRPQCEIEAQLQSTPFAGGHLVIGIRYAALDESTGDVSNWAVNDVSQLLQCDHVIVSAQSSNSSTLKVPFQYHLDRIPNTWTGEANMLYYYSLYVGVLNPLVVGPESLPSVDLNIYVKLTCDGVPTLFFGQRQQFDAFAPAPAAADPTRLRSLRKTYRIATPNGILGTIGDIVQTIAPIGDLIEPGLGDVGNVIGDVANTIDKIMPFNATVAPEAVGGHRPLLALDHPAMILNQTPSLSLGNQNLDAYSLRLDKNVMTPQPIGRLAHQDHLNNKYITSVSGLIGRFTVTNDQAPGTVVYNFDVTPINGFSLNDTTFQYTPMGALGLLYSRYSGDIELTFVVGSAAPHSLRMRVIYDPDFSTATITGLTPLELRSTNYGVVYDIQEQQKFTFKIPYQSPTPMNTTLQTSLSFRPSVQGVQPQLPPRFTYGRVKVILETPLIGNNAISPNIVISVLARGGDNFQYAVPRSSMVVPIPQITPTDRNVRIATPNMEERTNPETTVVNQPSGISGIPKHIGEAHDIKDLIRRFQLIGESRLPFAGMNGDSIYATADWPINYSLPYDRETGIFTTKPSYTLDPLTFIQDAFRFNKGGTRYAIEFLLIDSLTQRRLPLNYSIYHVPDVDPNQPNETSTPFNLTRRSVVDDWRKYFGEGMGLATEVTDTSYNSIKVVEVPYYQRTTCLLSDAISATALDQTSAAYANGRLVIVTPNFVIQAPPDTGVNYYFTLRVWRAAANDTHFSAFQGFPPYPATSGTVPLQAAGRVPPIPEESSPNETPTIANEQDFSYSCAKLNHSARRAIKLATRRLSKTRIGQPNMFRRFTNRIVPADITEAIQSLAVTGENMVNLTDRIEQIGEYVAGIVARWTSNFNAGSFMAHLACLLNWKTTTYTKIFSILGILSLFDMIPYKFVTKICEKVWGWISRDNTEQAQNARNDRNPQVFERMAGEVPPNPFEGESDAEPNFDLEASLEKINDTDISEIATLFASALCTTHSLTQTSGLTKKLLDASNSMSKTRSIQNFFALLLKWLKIGVRWVAGIKDPSALAAEELAAHSEELKAWLKSVDEICSANNQDRILQTPDLQLHVSELKDKGAALITSLPNLPPTLRPILRDYYKRLTEMHDKVGLAAGGGYRPQEAISMWFYGPPGHGKSNVIDKIAVEALRTMKIVYPGNPIYTRDGNPYWNGLKGQPCIKWDDVGVNNTSEWKSTFVTDYFNVHTCAPFNPNQADLKDKQRIVNARLVVIASNNPTFRDAAVKNEGAFLRRRDIVACVRLNSNWLQEHAPDAKNCNDPRITGDMLKNFDHLEFRRQSPLDTTDYADNADATWTNFNDFVAGMRKDILEIDAKRAAAAKQYLDLTNALSPDYWTSLPAEERPANMGDATILQSLDRDVRAVNAIPNYFPYDAWFNIFREAQTYVGPFTTRYYNKIIKPIAKFIERRFTKETDLEACYSTHALAPGSVEPLHEVEHGDDWESILDFTRINCGHRITTDFTLHTDDPDFGICYRDGTRIIRATEPCSRYCTLTHEGRSVLLLEMSRRVAQAQGVRITELETPEVIRRRFFKRPAYNIWTLIDKISRIDLHHWYDRFMWYVGIAAWIFFFFSFVHSLYIAFTTDWEAVAMAEEEAKQNDWMKRYESKELNDIWNSLSEKQRTALQMDPKLEKLTPQQQNALRTAFNSANLAVSGDLQTRHHLATRSTVAPRSANPNMAQEISPKITKNFIALDTINYTTGKRCSIWGLGVRNNSLLMPMHFWKLLENDKAEWKDVSVSKATYHEICQRKATTFELDYEVKGPIKIVCGDRPVVYAQSASVELEGGKYAIDITDMSDTDERLIITSRLGQTHNLKFSQFKVERLLTDEEVDLAFVTLPDRLPQFANIMKLISNEADHQRACLTECDLLDARTFKSSHFSKVTPVEFRISYPSVGNYTSQLVGYEYANPSLYYPCSSVLFDTRHSKILGLHVATSQGRGISAAISQELIPEAEGQERVRIPETVSDEPTIHLEGEFISHGAISNCLTYVPKTDIRPSLLNRDLPTVRSPVQLAVKGETVPCITKLKVGCEKQCSIPPLSEDKELGEYIRTYVHDKIVVTSQPVCPPRKRTILDAICGVKGVPFMDPINLNTAAGYPFNLEGLHSKSSLITRTNEGKITFIHPRLIHEYNEQHAIRLKGQRPTVVFSDFLKDERLKPGKDARLINGAPLPYTIEVRRYFMDFIAALQYHNLKNCIGIGLNMHGPDVSKLIWKLRAKGDKYICGDYKNFGPQLSPDYVKDFALLANQWYGKYAANNTPEDDRIRIGLMLDGANSFHLVFDHLYEVACGSPSGSPITAPINSYCNRRNFARAWMNITKNLPSYNSLQTFDELVAMVFYGDDVIACTNDEVASFFNNLTLSDYFATIGITYTDATKLGLEETCALEKATFLKTNFTRHPTRPGNWLAGLEKDLIYETPAWIRKSPDPLAATIENIHAALLNAHGHGPDFYNEFCSDMRKLAMKYDFSFDAKTWGMVDANFFDKSTPGIIFPKLN